MPETVLAAHQPQYLPYPGYFDKMLRCDVFVFLDEVQFKVREFQNRNRIRTKDGWMWLTVPVLTKGRRFQAIKDVRVVPGDDWGARHMRALEVNYGRAPFFDDYAAFFRDVYARSWERFDALCYVLIDFMRGCFGVETPCIKESELGTTARSTARIIELCRKVGADTYLSGDGGRVYLDEGMFEDAGIRLVYQNYSPIVYNQLHCMDAADFIPNLSAVDLLFNEGPAAAALLRREDGR